MQAVNIRVIAVRALLTNVIRALRRATVASWPSMRHPMTGALMDVLFVVLAVAFFVVTALIVKGVERL